MAGEYDIASQVNGYGSPGASALFGVQQELMRRAQLVEAARQRQVAEARQQAQDALNNERVQQEIAASKENVASNVELRKQNAEKAAEATREAQVKGITSLLKPGEDNSTAADAVAKIDPTRAALLFAKTTTPGAAAVPEGSQYEGQAEIPATPDVTKSTYKGTDEQQTAEEHKKFAQETLDGEHDTGNEAYDQYQKMQATQLLSSGKFGTIPAALVNGPKTATETDQRKYLDIATRMKTSPESVSPVEAAWAKSFESLHPTEATKQADAVQKIHITVDAADRRQNNTLTNAATQHEADAVQKKMDGLKLPQAANILETLKSPGGVNDVIAVPEFLSAMAGGIGRGLRMSQAELNMIQNARPGTESLEIKLKNLASGFTALTPDQRAAMAKLIRSVAEREMKLNDIYTLAQARVNTAKTPEEARRYVNDMNTKEVSLYKGLLDPAGSNAAGKSKYAVTVE
jgi:hypothetical protein